MKKNLRFLTVILLAALCLLFAGCAEQAAEPDGSAQDLLNLNDGADEVPADDGLDEGAYVYYVHSYAPQTNADTIARTTYGETFSAAIRRDNFFGTQFHPEKSGEVGLQMLRNFAKLTEVGK